MRCKKDLLALKIQQWFLVFQICCDVKKKQQLFFTEITVSLIYFAESKRSNNKASSTTIIFSWKRYCFSIKLHGRGISALPWQAFLLLVAQEMLIYALRLLTPWRPSKSTRAKAFHSTKWRQLNILNCFILHILFFLVTYLILLRQSKSLMDIYLKLFLFKYQKVSVGAITRHVIAEGHPPSEAVSIVSTERESARRAGPENKQDHFILEGVLTVCEVL